MAAIEPRVRKDIYDLQHGYFQKSTQCKHNNQNQLNPLNEIRYVTCLNNK